MDIDTFRNLTSYEQDQLIHKVMKAEALGLLCYIKDVDTVPTLHPEELPTYVYSKELYVDPTTYYPMFLKVVLERVD